MKIYISVILLAFAIYYFFTYNSIDYFNICCKKYGCKISGLCECVLDYYNLKCKNIIRIIGIVGGEQRYCSISDIHLRD
jgi:hypothetical protein